ncbi:MAG TPA: hypothetical protein VMN39_12390 [Longimicrobiaceae bacterium]|nr:hypothetical protein [Longimicrobiaceae bacterium]
MKTAARLTPYELVFTEGDFESRIFPQIRVEAGEAIDTLPRDKFDFIRTAGEVVRELTPDDAPPEALEQYRAILFHAFHFWAERHPLYLLEPATARYLVEAEPALDDWSFSSPARSLYLQLPANLFWSSISPDVPPEPVDGFFLTLSAGEDPVGDAYEHLDVLVVLGIRRARAGFSVIAVETEIGSGMENPWTSEARRGGDFANELPGGELAGLYSILTSDEVLKLVARALWYIESFPEGALEVPAPEVADRTTEPPSTHLSYVRITLSEAELGEGG